MSPWDHLKSVVSLGVVTLNLLVWLGPLLGLAALRWLRPSSRAFTDRWMDALYRVAVRVDDAWLQGVLGIRWDRQPPGLAGGIDRDRSHVVIANHVSWADIFVIQSLVSREGPPVKFLAKRELLRLPIVGAILWAFDFPMLRRETRPGEDDAARRAADLEALRAACRVVRERPAALMVFVEGTRFTPEKWAAGDRGHRHLLAPRVGGLATLLDALGDELGSVIDLTLVPPVEVSFWRFLSGRVREIGVEVSVFPPSALPPERAALADWLADRWRRKDDAIERLRGARARG